MGLVRTIVCAGPLLTGIAACAAGAAGPTAPVPRAATGTGGIGSRPEDGLRAPPRTPDERAAALFEDGIDAFRAGDYSLALAQFRGAYSMSPRPQILYNTAMCLEQLGNIEGAIRDLRKFLVESGDTVAPAMRQEVERRIDELGQALSGTGP